MSQAEAIDQVDEQEQEEATVIPLPVRITKKLLGGEDEADIQRSNLIELSEEMASAFNQAGAIEPPLDPLSLVRLTAMSGTLRPLIDAMAVNIHGFGYHFEQVIDLDASDAFDRVKAAMMIDAEHKASVETKVGEEPQVDEPTDEEVKERVASLRVQQRREKAKLEVFFENCSRKISFTRLCRKNQTDKESTGFAVFEVRRDGRGEPVRLNFAPSWTFRALPMGQPVEVDALIKATDISYRTIKEDVRFRRYVQIYESMTTYFKEFGDRRAMSADTGRYYKDEKELKAKEPRGRVATEILWFNLDSAESDIYGNVRWSGCIPGVIGSREQAEVNLLFFRSKAIPPMVVLVSGGTLKKGSREKLEEIIKHEIKGVENFHKILVLEAVSAKTAANQAAGLPAQSQVKIELQPLTKSIFSDALWRGYAEDNRNELGQSFRLPPMMRGDTDKLNRATAKIAREGTEQMVFGPERRDFEFDINRTVLTDMAIMLWRFRLNAPETTDAEQLADFLEKLSTGTLTVNEARRIASKLFGVDLPPIDADWARMPVKFALAGMEPEALPEDEEAELESADDAEAEKSDRTIIRLPQDQFDELIEVS